MAGPAFLKQNFGDLYGSAQLPALELLFRHELPMHEGIRGSLAAMKSTQRDIWQMSSTHDLDMFVQVEEGEDYSFVTTKAGASKTLGINKYGLGISISEEAIADGKFDELADLIKKLARSAQESREIAFVNLFNNGFSSETTPDGVAAFSASHTFPSGRTMSNVLSVASDLSESSLQTARYLFSTVFVGDTGIIYKMKPRKLLVHPANEAYAEELVGSSGKPDTNDNNLNSLARHGIQVVSSPHLTDEDAWFLLAESGDGPGQGCVIIEREGIVTKAGGPAVGFMNDSVLYKSRYRENMGWIHPYGVIASAGA
jgi:hypothetical protein